MAIRAAKAAFITLAFILLVAIGIAGYYFGRIVPLIKAGKQEGI